jgi:hypothetical protein
MLVAKEDFGGDGVGGEGEGSAGLGTFLAENGVEFADPVLLCPEQGADTTEFVLKALVFGLCGEDGRGGAFSALEGGIIDSAVLSAMPVFVTVR